ncbi:MAG: DUF4870 domain-containing protein [Planctomycetota bacterium]
MTEAPPASPGEVSKDARMWGMLCHLSALAGLVTFFGFLLGPLIVWLLKRNDFPFVESQGKESLNFQITMVFAFAFCIPLCFVAVGFVLLPVIGVVDIVLTVTAAIRASDGIAYRYPFALRLVA